MDITKGTAYTVTVGAGASYLVTNTNYCHPLMDGSGEHGGNSLISMMNEINNLGSALDTAIDLGGFWIWNRRC